MCYLIIYVLCVRVCGCVFYVVRMDFEDEYSDSSWLTQEPSLEGTQRVFDITSDFINGFDFDPMVSLEENSQDVVMSEDEVVESM